MRLSKSHRWFSLLLSVSILTGCAALTPQFDPPKVSLVGIRHLPSTGGTPNFEIKLNILNPNQEPLDIAGISYTITVLDKELIAGVANDIPVIKGYSAAEVALQAGFQPLELLRLIASLGTNTTKTLDYRLSAKIDFRGLMPTQRIVESGEFTFYQ